MIVFRILALLAMMGPLERAFGEPLCVRIFSSTPHFDRLSAESKKFWLEVGEQFEKQIESDFRRPLNQSILAAEIRRDHPFLRFFRKLGFQVQAEGVRAPPFYILLENLLQHLETLNAQLKKMDVGLEIRPELYLKFGDDVGISQSVVLSFLAPYQARGIRLDTDSSSLLKEVAFFKKASTGEFPMGGLNNATLVPRNMMEMKDYHSPNLMAFLHDLAHLDAFIRRPDFAKSYLRVFGSYYSRWRRMAPIEREVFEEEMRKKSIAWRDLFWFSEGAWVSKNPATYKKILAGWPILSRLISGPESINLEMLKQSLAVIDPVALKKELQGLDESWWQLFEPLGGGTSDMISTRTFTSKAQMPLAALLETLEQQILGNEVRPDRLALILGLLKYTPEMTVLGWEHMARFPDKNNSQMLQILKKMFPEKVLEPNSAEWSVLGKRLYPRFGQL